MKKIIFVTSNKGKIASAKRYLSDTDVESYPYDFVEPRSDDVKVIAKAKVDQAYKMVKQPCIAVDAGFFVESLNGFPRAFVNFMLDTIDIEGLIKLMNEVVNRECYFKECLAFRDERGIKTFTAKIPGKLAKAVRGKDRKKQWSRLWSVFIPKSSDKTLAEMNDDEREEFWQKHPEQDCFKKFAKYWKGVK
jgi:XTP/dITP diphosphohydrolase